ncbi:hypothetical protein THAOC_12878, partial [Thalassiosira oceanica]
MSKISDNGGPASSRAQADDDAWGSAGGPGQRLPSRASSCMEWGVSDASLRPAIEPGGRTTWCRHLLEKADRSPPGHRAGLLLASTSAAMEEEDGGSKDPPLFEAPFKGIARDYKMRLPLYGSDIKDGLNSQCLAAT